MAGGQYPWPGPGYVENPRGLQVDRLAQGQQDARLRAEAVREQRRRHELDKRPMLGRPPYSEYSEYPEGRPGGQFRPGQPLNGAVVHHQEAPNRIMRVPGFAALAFGTTSPGQQMQFQQSGEVIAIMACAQGVGSAAGQASLAVKITVSDDNEEIVTNGTAADFVSFANLCGIQTTMPMIFRRYVYVNQIWTFTVTNRSADTTFTPEIVVHFRRDPEGYRQVGP